MINLGTAKNEYLEGLIEDCQGAIAHLESITDQYDIFGPDDLDRIYTLKNNLENRITLLKASQGESV